MELKIVPMAATRRNLYAKPYILKNSCPGYLFKCDYGACISADLKCNGQRDCKDNSDEKRCSMLTVSKVNTNCRSDEFECNNGQCIEIDGTCDGVYNCEDHSDETEYLCLNSECPGYTYKCKYGACVDGDAECNGRQDCIDNSDEANCGPAILPTTPPSVVINDSLHTSNGCVTPEHPVNGRWFYLPNINNQKRAAISNRKVNSGATIGFQCNDGYKLSSTSKKEKLVYCQQNGQWNEALPSCIKLCPPQTNRNHAIISCKLDDVPIPCDQAIEQTELTFKCDPYFESDTSWTVNKCIGGSWHYPDVRCKEKCGEKRVSATPLIVGGVAVEKGHYPWVVALYSRRETSSYSHICGGSLLSTSIALTAAHCVTENNNGAVIHKKFFAVASGKYYIGYGDNRDDDTAQYSNVSQIIVHQDYTGEYQKFRFDIALLKLSTPFALSKLCQPVCIEYNDVSQLFLTDNSIATVTGWGFTTAAGKPSEVLKEIDVPLVDNGQCRSELDPEFAQKYLIGDKFCAGFVNANMSVCPGDSGGGLVIKDLKNKYYIKGLVSLGDVVLENNQRKCNIRRRALFTNVNMYTHWIQSTMLSSTIA
ncbi:modular serine protease-like isoform X2 [Euwallacea fornicatus]|uniref:modular serine protease-like isoform X2 n=1 Tax=Euwallacea fornicatus TaxID=995702 RepID=UPI00338E8577